MDAHNLNEYEGCSLEQEIKMNYLEQEWEQITSQKRKHKGCIFVRIKDTPDNFVLKIYGHKYAQEVADIICREHNQKIAGGRNEH